MKTKDKKLLFSITKKDFEIQPYKASGKGGQNRNKRETAIRLIHKESGIMVTCGDEREQHRNLIKAFKNLVNKPEFKKWLQIKIAKYNYDEKEVEKEVKGLMKEENLKLNIFKRDIYGTTIINY